MIMQNEEEKGKGRSATRPRERLKFQNFTTVVALLSLEQWRIAHGANRPYALLLGRVFRLDIGEAGCCSARLASFSSSIRIHANLPASLGGTKAW